VPKTTSIEPQSPRHANSKFGLGSRRPFPGESLRQDTMHSSRPLAQNGNGAVLRLDKAHVQKRGPHEHPRERVSVYYRSQDMTRRSGSAVLEASPFRPDVQARADAGTSQACLWCQRREALWHKLESVMQATATLTLIKITLWAPSPRSSSPIPQIAPQSYQRHDAASTRPPYRGCVWECGICQMDELAPTLESITQQKK